MPEYVVRKMLQYVHDFRVGTSWSDGECNATAERVVWTTLQRFAWRWQDRNSAAIVALSLDAWVVRLVPKCGRAVLSDVHKPCEALRQESERRKYLIGYEDGKRDAMSEAGAKTGA